MAAAAPSAVLGSQTSTLCFLSRLDVPSASLRLDHLANSEHISPIINVLTSKVERRQRCRVGILCSVKLLLDQRDRNGTSYQKPNCKEELLSALQRSLLESQWALESAQRAEDEKETLKSPIQSEEQMGVVRSGRPSARLRRLSARVGAVELVDSEDRPVNSSAKWIAAPVRPKKRRKNREGKVKREPVQDFISSFLRPTVNCDLLTKQEEQVFSRQMRIRQSLEKAKRKLWKELGHEPSFELWAHSVRISTGDLLSKVAEGEIARNKMMVAHLKLIVSVAKHYQHLGVDIADLIQEGSKGLLRGLERYDHRKGYKLSTYVHWWIRQGVSRAVADHSRTVRIPAYMHETVFAIKKARVQLINEGKSATVKNLSELLNMPSKRIQRALQVKRRAVSLDKIYTHGLGEEWNGMHEILPDQKLENQPWAILEEAEVKGTVRKRMETLTPKEQMIIRWHYGIFTEGSGRSTLAILGRKLGLSKERVRQIECTALQKMQSLPEDNSIFAI